MIAAAGRGRNGLRDAAHLTILYRTGFRCAESCNLDIGDLRELAEGGMVLRVAKPKGWESGALPREVGIDPQASATVAAWLLSRGSQAGPVFLTREGHRVLPSHIRRLIPQLGNRIGLGRRVHAHAFRHTFARELYDEGVGIVEIALALGHMTRSGKPKTDTTMGYLVSIGATEVVNATAGRGEW